MLRIKETNDIWDIAIEESLNFVDYQVEATNPQLRGQPTQRPVVTIGKPNFWELQEGGKAGFLHHLEPSTFLLARFAFSLRVFDSPIESATFSILLNAAKGAPTAFDLFPREENLEEKTNISLSISPKLQFFDTIEASVGTVETVIEDVQVMPIVHALGIGESNPSWSFYHHEKHPLRGIRVVYMIIEKPYHASSAYLVVDAQAQVRTRVGLFRTKLNVEENALYWEF